MKKFGRVTKIMRKEVIQLKEQGESYRNISLRTGVPQNYIAKILKEVRSC
ncbi:hypothetical protein [Clostridium coskatii]|uniref:Uncharacterized protein n=1 Tax=Clostridium coskatii TaxID=1705578 RepID=A0A166RHH7_9CLOT|nr:hypothetical protein [Clostridium coskatii]OAA90810.1 hypothetical protein WX73_01960 [Clostridium coskatii]OBR96844.1 hypothetical protein CLCOS_06880 [Clostridium coskatii]